MTGRRPLDSERRVKGRGSAAVEQVLVRVIRREASGISLKAARRLFALWTVLAILCLLPGVASAQSGGAAGSGPSRSKMASGATAAQSRSTVVTAPSGGMMPSGAPFTVQWNSPGQGEIYISLIGDGVETTMADNLANTGQAQVSLPGSVACNPQTLYKVWVARYYPDQYNSQNYWVFGAVSAPFRFTCPVTVTKQVVNTTGRRVPGSFRMRVQCEPGSQTFVDIAAPGSGSYSRKVHVPAGSTVCTVEETGMPLPPMGCSWLTTYPGGQQRPPGGAPVVVVNTLQCAAVSPPTPR